MSTDHHGSLRAVHYLYLMFKYLIYLLDYDLFSYVGTMRLKRTVDGRYGDPVTVVVVDPLIIFTSYTLNTHKMIQS